MKILMIDKYFFIKGGAERYYFELKEVLQSNGHKVVPFSMKHPRNFETPFEKFFVENIDYEFSSPFKKALALPMVAGRMIYSPHAKQRLEKLIQKEKPDLAHLHMIDHQLSPSILHTLSKYDIPVIQTIHQYKLVCPNYRLYNPRTNEVCERCLSGRFTYPMTQRCHKESVMAGALIALESYIHRITGIYENNVDIFHVPSHFMGKKLTEGGLGKDKIRHLFYTLKLENYPPNFAFEDYILYFGRLAKEKGVLTLLKAMKKAKDVKLRIVGEGPERAELEEYASLHNLTNVHFDGVRGGDELKSLVRKSRFVVVPSEWFDNSPLVIYESSALGKPVIGARMGGIPELIEDNGTGFHFDAGNPDELAEKITHLNSRPALISEFGRRARAMAEREFEPGQHYNQMYAWYKELVSA
ncbi:glycosyltransferase family 4 protein [bacterium]|nr:glycosyltransferase family 4 protein [bacterium]